MKTALQKYALSLQSEIDSLTEKLKNGCRNFAYWDGRNDTLIETLENVKKILGVK